MSSGRTSTAGGGRRPIRCKAANTSTMMLRRPPASAGSPPRCRPASSSALLEAGDRALRSPRMRRRAVDQRRVELCPVGSELGDLALRACACASRSPPRAPSERPCSSASRCAFSAALSGAPDPGASGAARAPGASWLPAGAAKASPRSKASPRRRAGVRRGRGRLIGHRLWKRIMSGPMIRVAGHDCQRPIELLGHERPDDLVRQRHGAEGRRRSRGALAHRRIEAVGAADDEGERRRRPRRASRRIRSANLSLVSDFCRARRTRPERSAPARSRRAAASSARRSASRRARLSGNLDDLEPARSRDRGQGLDALAIALDKFPLGAAFQPARRPARSSRNAVAGVSRRASRGRSAPHIFSRL